MGQKISTDLFRAKQKMKNSGKKGADIVSTPKSIWFADKNSYATLIIQDAQIREYLNKRLRGSGVAKIEINRYFSKLEITIHTAKPGLIIGKGGSLINQLKTDLVKKFKLGNDLSLNIEEFRDPNRSARVVAEDIAMALERGVPFRKMAKNSLERIKYSGILGANISIKGVLSPNSPIARKEEFHFGSIPRHTIDSHIDYHLAEAKCRQGIVGVKVMLYKGNKLTNYNYNNNN